MHIPQHVIEEAAVSLDSPVVLNYLTEVCRDHDIDPAIAPIHYFGPPLFAYRTLHAANRNAQDGLRVNPYPNPEDTMLGELMIEYLSASERMQVRTSPPHLRMDVARQLLDEKFRQEDGVA